MAAIRNTVVSVLRLAGHDNIAAALRPRRGPIDRAGQAVGVRSPGRGGRTPTVL